MSCIIHNGDALSVLRTLESGSVQCCITSPPYWGLRNYQVDGQIGLEQSPAEYVSALVEVFREVRRVLSDDATLWLNLGDSYSGSGKGGNPDAGKQATNKGSQSIGVLYGKIGDTAREAAVTNVSRRWTTEQGIKPKQLIGVPWRVAFALQEDGWFLRQWIPWVKRSGMPESVTDRPTSACEVIFLLAKSERYYYNHEAVRLPASMSFLNDSRWETGSTDRNEKNGYAEAKAQNPKSLHRMFDKQRGHSRRHAGFNERWDNMSKEQQCGGWRSTRNSDWFFESLPALMVDEHGEPLAFQVNPTGFKGAHFATFPENLVRPCVMAGCPKGGTVLDPFAGSGTAGKVAIELGRNAVLIELNPDYVKMCQDRCATIAPLL